MSERVTPGIWKRFRSAAVLLTALILLLLSACTNMVSGADSQGPRQTKNREKPLRYEEEAEEPEVPAEPVPPEPEPEEEPEEELSSPRGLVVIDAGHQGHANTDKEPIGPGASETKTKVAGGTRGVVTDVPEYQLTLDLSLLLRDELESRDYEVVLIRETNDVNISNAERAEMANELGADAFVRIHANGSSNADAHGAMTICQTPKNPYNSDFYEESHRLSEYVLDAFTEATGARREYVWETDSMSGINWCRVPVTIVEVGYMTNPDEDVLMQDPEYQEKMASGIADGIERFLIEQKGETAQEVHFRALKKYLRQKEENWEDSENWAVAVLSLEENLSAAAGQKEPMPAASLIKLFVAGAYLQSVEAGEVSDGYLSSMDKMLSYSDNGACNLLIGLLGMEKINQFIQDSGFSDTVLQRRMLETRTEDNENYTSAGDCAKVMRMIARGEYVSEEASARLLDDLLAQERRWKIPAGLPESVECANKTGELDNVENDAAIIWAPGGTYILCVMSEHVSPGNAQERIRDLSAEIYEVLDK